MAFLDKLSNMAKNAADKTSGMMEVAKINSKIGESKSKITARKTQIGEHYWMKYVSGENPDDDVIVTLCTEIKAEYNLIDELNGEIQKIKAAPLSEQENEAQGEPAAVVCASCGGTVGSGKKFCAECGTPVAPPQPEPAETPCPSCGQPVAAGSKFCQECGAASR